MPFTLDMPKLSPTMEEGVIARWHKKEGDEIEPGETLIEVTTDKATVEHNALDGGFLRKILVAEGSSAKINQPLAIFTTDANESIDGFDPNPQASKEETQKEAPKNTEVKNSKSSPEEEIASEKTVQFNQPLFVPEEPIKRALNDFSSSTSVKASPLAKKIAREKSLDLSSIKGSGPGGRIMSEDLDFAQNKALAHFKESELPTDLDIGAYEEIPMSDVQKVVANRLQASKTFIPHFYLNQKVNADALIRVRNELKNQQLKISFNDFVIKACALALKEHPKVNSGFNSQTQKIIRFKTIDISVAVSLEEGLITPIIRFADYKNLGEISLEIKKLAKAARENALKMEEFKGGSFTISNLGMFGTTSVLPVINPPQAAILGVGGLEDDVLNKHGELLPTKSMCLTLAADHRAINGEEGAKFLKTLKSILENPSILLI